MTSSPTYPVYINTTTNPCTNYSYTQGEWVYDPHPPQYGSYGDILGSCAKDGDKTHNQYRWMPQKCTLHTWDEEIFCRALRGRNIMFVGDSIQDHWHASLVYLLGSAKKDIYAREGTVFNRRPCGGHAICGKYYPKPLKLFHVTNQFLTK
eukprot:PhF_6_TR5223/c0_g2_i1/m.7540